MAETVSSMDAPIRGGRFRDLPLFWKVLIPFFTLMLVLGVLGAFLIVRDLSTNAKSRLDQDLIGRSLDVESFFHERELYLLESANFAANLQDMPQAIARGDQATVARLLQSVLALKTDVNLLSATDTGGRPIVEFVRDRSRGRPRRVSTTVGGAGPLVATALGNESGAKSSGFVDAADETMVAIVAPVCSSATPCDGVGVTIVGIKASAIITEALAALESSAEISFGLALFDSEGHRVASRGLVPDDLTLPSIAEGRPVARVTTTQGREIETLYSPLEVQNERFGTIAVATETSPAFGSARGTGIRLGLILLAAMTGIVAIGALLSRAILRQLQPLVATNRALGSGDLTARAEILGNDELGELARGVNLMADQLQANIETLESRVDQRTQEVRRLLRERTEFFAGLSHELRTPLAIILNQSLMLRDPTFRKTRNALEGLGLTIGDSAEQLLSLVNEILELARSELGGIELELEDVNLGDHLRQFGGSVEGLASAAGLELRIEPPKRLPTVRADPERLRQILLNLVDNAVKYTPAGGTIELDARASNGHGVTVAIRDTGVGIPPDVGERIFDPFFRVPGTKAQRGQASSGLGLALTKRLVEAHGGEIWFTSEPDVGTTFNVTLPVKPKSSRKKAPRA